MLVLVVFASMLIKMVGTRLDAWKIGKAHACHIFQKQNKYLHLVGTKVSPMVCLCWLSSLCLHQCANKNGWDKTRCLKIGKTHACHIFKKIHLVGTRLNAWKLGEVYACRIYKKRIDIDLQIRNRCRGRTVVKMASFFTVLTLVHSIMSFLFICNYVYLREGHT